MFSTAQPVIYAYHESNTINNNWILQIVITSFFGCTMNQITTQNHGLSKTFWKKGSTCTCMLLIGSMLLTDKEYGCTQFMLG